MRDPDVHPNGATLAPASADVAVAADAAPGGPRVRTTDAGVTWSAVSLP